MYNCTAYRMSCEWNTVQAIISNHNNWYMHNCNNKASHLMSLRVSIDMANSERLSLDLFFTSNLLPIHSALALDCSQHKDLLSQLKKATGDKPVIQQLISRWWLNFVWEAEWRMVTATLRHNSRGPSSLSWYMLNLKRGMERFKPKRLSKRSKRKAYSG